MLVIRLFDELNVSYLLDSLKGKLIESNEIA